MLAMSPNRLLAVLLIDRSSRCRHGFLSGNPFTARDWNANDQQTRRHEDLSAHVEPSTFIHMPARSIREMAGKLTKN